MRQIKFILLALVLLFRVYAGDAMAMQMLNTPLAQAATQSAQIQPAHHCEQMAMHSDISTPAQLDTSDDCCDGGLCAQCFACCVGSYAPSAHHYRFCDFSYARPAASFSAAVSLELTPPVKPPSF